MGRTLFTSLGAAVLSAAILLGAPMAAAQTAPAKASPLMEAMANYTYVPELPEEIPGVGFTMPKQAFLDLLASKKLTYTTNAAKNMFLVQPPGAPYGSVVYFFNSNAGEILTEIEIRCADDAGAKAYFDAAYKPQEYNGDYFRSDGVSAYRVKAWRFQSKVYVVVTMTDTRWAGK